MNEDDGHLGPMGTPGEGAALVAAYEICDEWGLTAAEAEALVTGNPTRAAAVIRIEDLLDGLYSGELPRMWMAIPNRNPHIGGVRPVDHALATEGGLWEVLRLLEGYAQGK